MFDNLDFVSFMSFMSFIYFISGLLISTTLLFAYNRQQKATKSFTFPCDIRTINEMSIYDPVRKSFIIVGSYITSDGVYSGKAAVYNLEGECIKQLKLEGRPNNRQAILLLSNGKIIITGWFWDERARIWNINTGDVQIIQKLPGPYHYQMDSMYQSSHNTFIAIHKRLIFQYDIDGDNPRLIGKLEENEGSKFIGFANQQILIAQLDSHENSYSLVGITSCDPIKNNYSTSDANAIVVLDFNRVAWLSSSEQRIYIYDITDKKLILSFSCKRMGVEQSDYLGVFKNNIVTFDGKLINIWKATGQHLQSITPKCQVSGIAASFDRIIITSYLKDNQATVYY